VLLDFLVVQGYPSEEYKVISSWPRRDVSLYYCFEIKNKKNLFSAYKLRWATNTERIKAVSTRNCDIRGTL